MTVPHGLAYSTPPAPTFQKAIFSKVIFLMSYKINIMQFSFEALEKLPFIFYAH